MSEKTQTTEPNEEWVKITISYGDDVTDERLEASCSWQNVPDQNKVWDKAKQLIDSLYIQVRG